MRRLALWIGGLLCDFLSERLSACLCDRLHGIRSCYSGALVFLCGGSDPLRLGIYPACGASLPVPRAGRLTSSSKPGQKIPTTFVNSQYGSTESPPRARFYLHPHIVRSASTAAAHGRCDAQCADRNFGVDLHRPQSPVEPQRWRQSE